MIEAFESSVNLMNIVLYSSQKYSVCQFKEIPYFRKFKISIKLLRPLGWKCSWNR